MKTARAIVVVFAAILFGWASVAPAMAIVTVPTDLNPGDQYRLAFVTSTTRDATSTNISDYNVFVTGVANGVPELNALGTTWTAIGSTEAVDARDNTGTNPTSTGVPVYRLDDVRIANNNNDLWDGDLFAPIIISETGAGRGGRIWTGSDFDGRAFLQAALGASRPILGRAEPALTSGGWIIFEGDSQTLVQPLYGISSVLTAPTPIPVPAAFYLFGTAIVGLLSMGWQRLSASA